MNETLFSQIQRLLERTYAQVGINLEDCIIDRVRSVHLSKLAGASARELNEIARTFLRHAGDQLYIGIYYSRWLIDQLERHDPRSGLSDSNIRSLIVFVEELNHALHAALQFKNGQRRIASEEFARDLELQAQVDTYLVLLLFVAFFRKTQRVSRTDRRWLRFHLFSRQCPEAFRNENLRGRYLETCGCASGVVEGMAGGLVGTVGAVSDGPVSGRSAADPSNRAARMGMVCNSPRYFTRTEVASLETTGSFIPAGKTVSP